MKQDELNPYFDFSTYPTSHTLYNLHKKKAVGYLKDENNSTPIMEFIGIKSKLYSVLSANENKKTAKGLQNAILKKYITHNDYKECIDNTIILANTRRIQSKKFDILTIKTDKMVYTPFDDKRCC